MSEPHSGHEDWPWLILQDYNFNTTLGSKFEWYHLDDDIAVLRLCNKETSMCVSVKFDPALIDA